MAKHDVTGNGKRDYEHTKTSKVKDGDGGGKHTQQGGDKGSGGGKK